MDDAQDESEPLLLLARLHRERRSGLVTLGPGQTPLVLVLREGHITALGPFDPPPAAPDLPGPDDSASLRLRQILAEIGVEPGRPREKAGRPAAGARALRERVLALLASDRASAVFEEGKEAPRNVAETAGPTEPFILEAVRRLRDADDVRALLGDLDQRLVCTPALAEERTLTLLEGYLLSRVDGTASARQVLQQAPLDSEEAERGLLGLLLTGRVELRQPPAPHVLPHPEAAAPPPEPSAAPEPPAPAEAPPFREGPPAGDAPLDPQAAERRREVLEIFQSLPLKRSHFEVLGVEPGCTDAEARRAYSALVKRFHPDVGREPGLEDLRDVLAAIFIRVQEAWEVIGDARSRSSYEVRSGVVRRPGETPPSPYLGATPETQVPPTPGPAAEYVDSEATLRQAQILLLHAKYWEAITVLETAVPRMAPPRHQNRGRILLARAYAKNPNWLRKAEEQLQDVLRSDPQQVDALFQLGLLYKQQGLAARAQGLFRRAIELKPDHKDAAAELAVESPPAGGLLKRLFGRGKAS